MFRGILLAALAAASGALILSGVAQADRRQYLATYGYYTPEKGEVEIEQWTDAFVPKHGSTSYRTKTEIEYGITDRLAAGLYFVNKSSGGGPLKYNETKLELRYRFNEPGRQFWDTAGYLEIVRPNHSDDPYETEVKAIFSHEFPKFNLSLNIIGEKELAGGEEIELGYAVGIAPHLTGRTNYSFEAFGSDNSHYVMPAFWLIPGPRQNIGIGIAKGLTKDSDKFQVRTLYTIEF